MKLLGLKTKNINNIIDNVSDEEFQRQIEFALKESQKEEYTLSKEEKLLKLVIQKSKEENNLFKSINLKEEDSEEDSEEDENEEEKNEKEKEKEKEKEEKAIKNLNEYDDEKIEEAEEKLIEYAINLSNQEREKELIKEKQEENLILLAIEQSKKEINNKITIDSNHNRFKKLFKISKKEGKNNNKDFNNKDKNKINNLLKEEEFNEDFGICPITQEYMKNPVLTPGGFYYEKSAIIDWIKRNKTDPISREYLDINMLIEDVEYKKKIREYRRKYKK